MKAIIVEIEGGNVVKVQSNFKGVVIVKDRDGLQVGEGISRTLHEVDGKQAKACKREIEKWNGKG